MPSRRRQGTAATVRSTTVQRSCLSSAGSRREEDRSAGHCLRSAIRRSSRVASCDVLEFAVQLATLQTGIELRDRHMRDEVLEVQRFPVATLRVPNAPLATASTSGTTRAELTVHGQTHPMEVSFQVAQRGGYDVTATFRMDLRDYGMTAPVYLGVKVKPEVDVSADFHLDAP